MSVDPGSEHQAPAFDPRPGSTRERVGLLIGGLGFLALLALPGIALEPMQRRCAAVCWLVAVLWVTEAVPIGISSLLPAVLFPLLGVMSAEKAAPAYFKDIVLLFLGAMWLALGLEAWGVHRRLALGIAARVGTRPRRLVLGFLIATSLVSMFLNNTATALMMLPIAMAVLKGTAGGGIAQPTRGSPFACALLLAVAYGASVGGMITPVGTAPNQVLLGTYRASFPDGPSMGFGAFTVAWLPLLALWIPLAWILLTRVLLKVEDRELAAGVVVQRERAALGRMRPAERRMAGLFALAALLWITRVDLDLGVLVVHGWEPFVRGLAGVQGGGEYLSDATVALGLAVAGFLVPSGDRERPRLFDWSMSRNMPWDILLLIGSGFCIADAIRTTGLDRVIGGALAGWMDGTGEASAVLIIVLAVAGVSELASNTATAQVLLPVLGATAAAAGFDPRAVLLPAAAATSCGFMLPAGTPPNALAYATRLVPAPVMARVGIAVDLATALLVWGVFELWGRRIVGIGPLGGGAPDWAR